MQTADAHVYREMLHHTANVNIAYCARHHIEYESYIGVKRGKVAWQASYNR